MKIGDHIIPVGTKGTVYDRVVIGVTSDGQRVAYEYREDGRVVVGSGKVDQFKLAPVKKEGWVNVYAPTRYENVRCGAVYPTEDAAKAAGGSTWLLSCRLATIKIEWEE